MSFLLPDVPFHESAIKDLPAYVQAYARHAGRAEVLELLSREERQALIVAWKRQNLEKSISIRDSARAQLAECTDPKDVKSLQNVIASMEKDIARTTAELESGDTASDTTQP